MKIAVVVHGPNIIDSKYAIKIINFLKKFGTVKSRLGGTMGRTAVIDASLEDVIDISNKLLPSESLKLFHNENVDVIFLINYGKSSTTGHVFGYKVFNNYLDNITNNYIPIIQIERPGEEDGSIIYWNYDKLNDSLIQEIASKFQLKIITPETIEKKHFKSQKLSKNSRIIHGVSPNENILINGIVVGKSNSDKLILVSRNNFLTEIKGGNIKQHGVDKLGQFNLKTAIVKTGLLRKTKVNPRTLNLNNDRTYFKVSFLDHAAENIYNFKDSDLIITVGDDTTFLACDILYRFNIPVIGITDGDLDKLVENGFKTNDSIIIQVQEGFDDIVGCEIFKRIFNEKNFIKFNLNSLEYNNFKKDKINEIKDNIIKIINKMNYKYIIE